MRICIATLLVQLATEPTVKPPLGLSEVGYSIFELQVTSGAISNATVVQAVVPFIERSRLSLKDWEFADTGPELSYVSVTFLYNPKVDLPDLPFVFEVPLPDSYETLHAPFPVKIFDPGYPLDGLAGGTVVLQLGLSPEGAVNDIEVVTPTPRLTIAADAAVRRWKFHVPPTADAASLAAFVVISFERPNYAPLP